MTKWIMPTILGLILLSLGFWLGRRSNKTVAFEVYDPQTRMWQDLSGKAAKLSALSKTLHLLTYFAADCLSPMLVKPSV